MANKDFTDPARMEKIVSLCKRRGFIFQAGELYGGLNGCWDYGPLGAELKRNLKDYWWRKTVQERDDVLGMDGAILTMEQVLVSSGHVGGFSDPMCDCLLSKARLRADQIPAQDGTAVYFSAAKHEATGWSSDKPFAVLVAPARTRSSPTRRRGNSTPTTCRTRRSPRRSSS
jgi:glycyl-tRNA synthetase